MYIVPVRVEVKLNTIALKSALKVVLQSVLEVMLKSALKVVLQSVLEVMLETGLKVVL